MKVGIEIEFLALTKTNQIFRMFPGVLMPSDLVGVDGHWDTIEIRGAASNSAPVIFNSIARAVRKYQLAVQRVPGQAAKIATWMRAGAMYGTTLGMHVHYSGLPASTIPSMVKMLHRVLVNNFAVRVMDEEELKERAATEYGQTGLASVRIKSGDWWEWRELPSLAFPLHTKVVIGVAIAVGNAIAAGDLAVLACKNMNEMKRYIDMYLPPGDKDVTLQALTDSLKLGVVDYYTDDMLPYWRKV